MKTLSSASTSSVFGHQYQIVAQEAEVTFKAIKQLNKRLVKTKSGEDKREILALIEKEKSLWWDKTRKHMW